MCEKLLQENNSGVYAIPSKPVNIISGDGDKVDIVRDKSVCSVVY